MRSVVFALTCLACVGRARRLQTSHEQLAHSSLAESQKSSKAAASVSNYRPLRHRQSVGQAKSKGASVQFKALSLLLLELNPLVQNAGDDGVTGRKIPNLLRWLGRVSKDIFEAVLRVATVACSLSDNIAAIAKVLKSYNSAAEDGSDVGRTPSIIQWLGRINKEVLSAVVQAINHLRSLNRFPTVTSFFIALNVLVYSLQDGTLSAYEYGLQPLRVWRKKGLSWQMVLSSFLHYNSEHLLIDMVSLLLQGSNFEEVMRPRSYMKLLSYAAVAPNAVLVLATKIWTSFSRDPAARTAYQNMYIDFSGALFCLATVWRCQVLAPLGKKMDIFGIAVPCEHAYVELVIQKLLNPSMSILRQACGLVAGMVYAYWPKFRRSMRRKLRQVKRLDPLKQRLLLSYALFLFACGMMMSVQIKQAALSSGAEDLKEFREALNEQLARR